MSEERKKIGAMVLCALPNPKTDLEKILYDLYISSGKSGNGFALGRNAYRPYGPGGVMYNPEDKYDYVPWQIPQWALSLALRIQTIVIQAESIGRESGYDRGIKDGKSFVMQLADGKMAMNDFYSSDGRDPRRLNRKKW